MPQLPANAISHSVVTRPPSLLSWPASTMPRSMYAWTVSNAAFTAAGSSRSGDSLPTLPRVCASALPPRRFLPQPRSMKSRTLSPGRLMSGVTVLRMSGTAA